jgi:glycosyltransferase involved in cell wall biosynthesis
MYPSPARPALGPFVRDQVEALRRRDDVEVELFAFDPGPRELLRAAVRLRREFRGRRFDIVHAHFGLTAWPALLARLGPVVVTLHGNDLLVRRSYLVTRAALPFCALTAAVSREFSANLPGAGARPSVAVRLAAGVRRRLGDLRRRLWRVAVPRRAGARAMVLARAGAHAVVPPGAGTPRDAADRPGAETRRDAAGPTGSETRGGAAVRPGAETRSGAAVLPRARTRRRVAVLPVGIDLERFRSIPRREARKRLGLDPDGRYLLFPHDPSRPLKRYDRALAAAGDVPLLTLGGVPPDDVPYWINAANAMLVPSEKEAFGLSAIEALACDVPVLATPVGIHPVVLNGVAGAYCAPFDRAAWRAALRPHLEADDPRVEGRARAALFGADAMAARVVVAWRDLLAERSVA